MADFSGSELSDIVGGQIEVHGLRNVSKALRKLESKEFLNELRAAHRRASDAAAAAAASEAPARSGALRGSIKSKATNNQGAIKAGTNTRIVYAGPIHFGWPSHNIPANEFMYRGVAKALPEIQRIYESEVKDLFKKAGL